MSYRENDLDNYFFNFLKDGFIRIVLECLYWGFSMVIIIVVVNGMGRILVLKVSFYIVLILGFRFV